MIKQKNKWPTCEADVASLVFGALETDGWDCYPEAQVSSFGGARADIAAVKDGKLLIVETKTSLNNYVIEQAILWTAQSHWTYIAVPRPRRASIGKIRELALRYYGIGMYYIHNPDQYLYKRCVVEEIIPAKLHRKANQFAKRIISGLHQDMKKYRPGTKASEGFSTPWRRTMDAVKQYISKHPGCTIREVLADVSHHYGSDATARACLPKYLLMEKEKGVRGELLDGAWRFFPE